MSKPLLKVRCLGCNGEIARVTVHRTPDDSLQKTVEFRSLRKVLRPDGGWDLERSPGRFQEPLRVDPVTGYGKTKAQCACSSYWLSHAELEQAIRDRVGVLKLGPGQSKE